MDISDIGWLLLMIVILDTVFLGIIPWLLKFGYPYRKLLKNDLLIKDKPLDLNVFWNGSVVNYIFLTKNYLILADTRMTSVVNLSIDEIDHFSIIKKKKKYTVIKICTLPDKNVHTRIRSLKTNKPVIFRFKTNIIDNWVDALLSLGIDLNNP